MSRALLTKSKARSGPVRPGRTPAHQQQTAPRGAGPDPAELQRRLGNRGTQAWLAQNEAMPAVQRRSHAKDEEELVQRKPAPLQTQRDADQTENRTGMPGQLKSGLEALSGMDLTGVRVHSNSAKPVQLNSLAYTQGQDIHVGPGQEKHLPHEGWHAVQQMQGRVRPTTQAVGVPINDDPNLEREADLMGTTALQTQVPIKQKRGRRPVVSSFRPMHDNTQVQRVAVSPSARFGGDKELEEVFSGTKIIKNGSNGIQVVKIQQALLDMGYLLPKFGVDGKFGDETETAVKKFQHDKSIPETGEVDKTTLDKLQEVYDTRQPYIDNATLDPADPGKGTRALDASEKAAVKSALVPTRGLGGTPPTFKELVGGKKYGDEIRAELTTLIPALHASHYASKMPLRGDPTKMHSWSALEKPAAAAKEVTDALYGTYNVGPAITHATGKLVDQWDDEVARNTVLSLPEQKAKAKVFVQYLINSNCSAINKTHSAVPSAALEKAILDPIVGSFVNTGVEVKALLEIEVAWTGAELGGMIYLQRFKESTDDKNRELMWKLFHTCIHEYLHALAHADFETYAEAFRTAGDTTRYNTLIEGFTDFFTENVRKTVSVTPALRMKVEGTYYDATKSAPAITPGLYPSRKQAEQVVSIVGIRNTQAAFFKGEVDKIGGP